MRVPIYDSPQVAPAAPATPHVGIDTAGAFGEALNQGATQLATGVADVMREAKDRADVVANADALSSYQEGLNDQLANHDTGILTAQGKASFDRANGYRQRITNLQQDALKSLNNDQQRAMFIRQSRRLTQGAIERVEMHLGEQHHVIENDALENTFQSGLKTVATDPIAPVETAIEGRARYEGQLRKLGRDDDFVNTQLARYDQQAASAVLRPLISKSDPNPADADRAKQLLDAPYAPGPDGKVQTLRQALGTSAPEYVAAVNTLTGKAGGDALALQKVNEARRPNGSIDEADLAKRVEALPPEQRTSAFEQSLGKYSALERSSWADQVDSHFKTALTAVQKRNQLADVPADTQNWLEKNAPLEWGHIKRGALADARADRFSDAQERRDQADADRKGLSDFNALSPEEQRGVDVDHDPRFADVSEKTGGRAAIKAAKRALLNRIDKAGLEPENEFRDQLRSVAENSGFAADKVLAPQFYGAMGAWRSQQMLQGGKPPTREDVQKQIQYELTQGKTGGLGGWFASTKRRFQLGQDEHFNDETAPSSSAAAPVQTSAPTQRAPATLEDSGAAAGEVPTEARAEMLRWASDHNKPPPSEDQLRAAYAKGKAIGRFK